MSGVFDPNAYLKTVTIVGVGGTGAQVARIVGRMAYDMQRSRRHAPQIVLIDPDVVEEKNVGRQLFSPSLLGRNKAECVGRMLNLALGLDVRWIPDHVDPIRHFDRYGSNLVVSCVDNHEARKAIHQVSGVGVFGGNDVKTAQVCIGNADDPDLVRRFLDGREGTYPYLPKEGLLFPELLQPEPEPIRPTPEAGVSCADLVAEGRQHLLVNDMVASMMGQYIYNLLHRLPIRSFLSYISMGDFPGIRSLPICREELEVLLGDARC
jgi:PRTRC genetic system ThiF family protein